MLFKLLDQVVSRINALDLKKETPTFLNELKRACPNYGESLHKSMVKKGTKEEVIKLIEQSVALAMLKSVKDIPKIVEMMVSKINDKRTSPALCCALVGGLALLVKPRDLIPDDAPGGYGFLDDAILLRAALIEYMNVLPPDAINEEKERRYLQLLSIGIPPRVLPAMQTAITGIQLGVRILNQLPPFLLEYTTQLLIQNPMLAEIQSPPPGMQPTDTYKLPSQTQIRNMLGQTLLVEGGNVSMTFSDGGSAFLSESGDLLVVTD